MGYFNTFDLVDPYSAIILFIIGTIIFPATFYIQKYWFKKTESGRQFTKHYGLTEKDTIDISNKIVSAFQALCAGVSGWLVYKNCVHDVIHSTNVMSIVYAWFGIPYFVYDTFCMFYVYTFSHPSNESMIIQFIRFVLKTPVIFIHHMIMAPIGWTLIMFYRDAAEPGDFYVGILYMMECSTPFVSIRFILSKLKMKSSPWYVINGILMLFSFPIFRILSVVYSGYLFIEQSHYPTFLQGIMGIPIQWMLVWISAVVPQIYWFFLMWKGLLKIFRQQPKSSLVDESSSSSSHLIKNKIPSEYGISKENNGSDFKPLHAKIN